MKRLLAALERIASALEQLVPAVQQATREQRYSQRVTLSDDATSYEYHGTVPNPDDWSEAAVQAAISEIRKRRSS